MNQEKNILLANKVGFKYVEYKVMYEMIEGIETPEIILSKVPFVFSEITEEECKYIGDVIPSNPNKWSKEWLERNNGKINWFSENFLKYIPLKKWNPDKDWNQLMEVANAMNIRELPTNKTEAYNKIFNLLSHYDKK